MSPVAEGIVHRDAPAHRPRAGIVFEPAPVREGSLKEDLEPLMVLLGAIYGWVIAVVAALIAVLALVID